MIFNSIVLRNWLNCSEDSYQGCCLPLPFPQNHSQVYLVSWFHDYNNCMIQRETMAQRLLLVCILNDVFNEFISETNEYRASPLSSLWEDRKEIPTLFSLNQKLLNTIFFVFCKIIVNSLVTTGILQL